MLTLRESRQEVLSRGSDEEPHLDNSEESWLFAEREESPRDVDGYGRNALTPVPDDLHQETDWTVGEGSQAAVRYGVVDSNMELMLETSVLAQGILFVKRGMKANMARRFFCHGACSNASVLNGLNSCL